MNEVENKKFIEDFRFLRKQKKFANYSDKTSQKLDKYFNDETYLLYQEFGNFDVSIRLNQRKIIKSYGDWTLALNYNSEDFVRDANYSLSLVQKNKEIAIICFYPIKNRTIRIVQIQGQKGFLTEDGNLLKDWKKILIDELKIFSYELRFKRIEILRAEENYLFKFPRKVESNFSLQEDQKSMLYLYNVLPVRKWGFKYKNGEHYSVFIF